MLNTQQLGALDSSQPIDDWDEIIPLLLAYTNHQDMPRMFRNSVAAILQSLESGAISQAEADQTLRLLAEAYLNIILSERGPAWLRNNPHTSDPFRSNRTWLGQYMNVGIRRMAHT
jgi:hypothetical protein|tara:strand:+ start:320 stop:667 length:348 start_codon:yes stop_codon:yes gene_type:complete